MAKRVLVVDDEQGVREALKQLLEYEDMDVRTAESGSEALDAYNAFLDDFIFRLPGVAQVRSNIVLKEIKADTALPFRF